MVLLVIDTQKGITDDRLYGFKELEENIKTLIKTSRENGVEVVFVRHDDGPGSGFSKGDADFEIYEGFAPMDGEKIFDKNVNSSFHESTGLTLYLKSKNINTVIAVGLQTDYCVDATIKSGFEKGFKMVVPEYCNSTRANPYMDAKTAYEFYNKNMWPGRYATCLSIEETLEMIRNHKNSVKPARINACGTQEIEYRIATKEDMDLLMSSRLEMLKVVNNLDHSYKYSDEMIENSRKYFENGNQTTVLALDGDRVIGCATMCYIYIMPTFSHTTGKRAHLMNVYTMKEWQRQGIAKKMVSMLIEEAWKRGVTEISLDATEEGRQLYYKLGFTDSTECMVLVKP